MKITETNSVMSGILEKKRAHATFVHPFTLERVTISRPNRVDHDPFVIALIVAYPDGSSGVWRMYSEKRTKAMEREERALIRQTEALHTGLEHMLGASVLRVPVSVESVDDSSKKVFPTRKEARQYARSKSVPISWARKMGNGWTIEKNQKNKNNEN